MIERKTKRKVYEKRGRKLIFEILCICLIIEEDE